MRTLVCFLLFVVIGLVLFFAIGEQGSSKRWLESLGAWAWVGAVLLMIADIFIPVPSNVVITLMAQLYGPLLGGAIGTLGTFLAGVVAYGLTRGLGQRFADWLLKDERASAERFFNDRGAFAVACSRWLPLLPEAISCMAGLARMPFGKYCIALLCGAVPMSYAYAALASISDNELVPLVISVILPLPIWLVAARLLHLNRSPRP